MNLSQATGSHFPVEEIAEKYADSLWKSLLLAMRHGDPYNSGTHI